jgi:hypothetical protein
MKKPTSAYKVVSPYGTLLAHSVEDAKAITIWPDSIIIRTEDGAWIDEPLCMDQRSRLAEIHHAILEDEGVSCG